MSFRTAQSLPGGGPVVPPGSMGCLYEASPPAMCCLPDCYCLGVLAQELKEKCHHTVVQLQKERLGPESDLVSKRPPSATAHVEHHVVL